MSDNQFDARADEAERKLSMLLEKTNQLEQMISSSNKGKSSSKQ